MKINREAVTLYRVTCLRYDGTTKHARDLRNWSTDVREAKLFKSYKQAKSIVTKLGRKYAKEMPRPTKGYQEYKTSQYIIEEIELTIVHREYLERKPVNGH